MDAVLIGVALAVIGVPLVLPLVVLTFFGAFIPLVGAVVVGSVAALVALVSVGVVPALLVVLAITLIQQLEGDLVYPQLVGRALSLHPVAVLLAITAGAVIGGVIGALVAVPAVAVIWTVASYLRDEHASDAGGVTTSAAPGSVPRNERAPGCLPSAEARHA